MGMVMKSIDVSKPLTKKQLEMLKKAKDMPRQYDEDNPPLTKEELSHFKRVKTDIREDREKNRKQNVTLRLSPQTVKRAKSLGKGYTSILARIVEKALENPTVAEQLLK